MINKKRLILSLSIILILVIGIGIFFWLKLKSSTQAPSDIPQASIQEHNKVYADPAAKQIRTVLDSYIQGKIIGTTDPNIVINGDPKIDKESILLTGLKKFSPDYYKSKFIILDIHPYSNGGTFINIEFVNKPDKIFAAGVYPAKNNSHDLRFFGQDLQFTPAKIQMFNINYSFMLHDLTHQL